MEPNRYKILLLIEANSYQNYLPVIEKFFDNNYNSHNMNVDCYIYHNYISYRYVNNWQEILQYLFEKNYDIYNESEKGSSENSRSLGIFNISRVSKSHYLFRFLGDIFDFYIWNLSEDIPNEIKNYISGNDLKFYVKEIPSNLMEKCKNLKLIKELLLIESPYPYAKIITLENSNHFNDYFFVNYPEQDLNNINVLKYLKSYLLTKYGSDIRFKYTLLFKDDLTYKFYYCRNFSESSIFTIQNLKDLLKENSLFNEDEVNFIRIGPHILFTENFKDESIKLQVSNPKSILNCTLLYRIGDTLKGIENGSIKLYRNLEIKYYVKDVGNIELIFI